MPTAELGVEASESLRSERRERERGRLRRVDGGNNTWVGVFKWIDDLAISHWKAFGSELCNEGLETGKCSVLRQFMSEFGCLRIRFVFHAHAHASGFGITL